MNPGFENTLKAKGISELTNGINVGYFVFYESDNSLRFQDANQKNHSIERVVFLNKEFDIKNGEKNIPKPYLIGDNSEVKEYGANVLYSFLGNEFADIVVFGAVNKLNMQSLDSDLNNNLSDYENLEEKHISRNNDRRFFKVREDAAGNLAIYLEGKEGTGNFSLKVYGNDNQENGNIKIEANGKFAINQVGDDEEIISQIFIDNTEGEESIIIKSPKVKIMNSGVDLQTILEDLLTAIQNMTFKHPQGPTLPVPTNWSDFEAVKTKIQDLMEI